MSRNPYRVALFRHYSGPDLAWLLADRWGSWEYAHRVAGSDAHTTLFRIRWAARHATRRLREQRDAARQAARLYREDMHAAQDRVARLEAQLARVRRACNGYPSALADIIRRGLDE